MLVNYIKLSLRLLARNPFFTIVNVFGLAVGFASFLALWSYSTRELKADQYHKDYDRIVRVGGYWRWTDDGKNWDFNTFGFTKSDLAVRIKEDFSEVEHCTRILTQQFFSHNLVPHGRFVTFSAERTWPEKKKSKEEKVVYADESLFKIFTIPLVQGNADDVLHEAGSVVLSEKLAKKYFGEENPIGQLLDLNDNVVLKVTGVSQNLPHHTHLDFDAVISNRAYLTKWETAHFSAVQTFVKLKKGFSPSQFEKLIKERKKEYWSDVLRTKPNVDIDMFVQPLKDVIFSPSFEGDTFTVRSRAVLTTFAIISIVVLVMAWCNYLNVWIARNSKRAKELATRRVNGATVKDFVAQFVTESSIVHVLSILLAITILQLTKEPFQILFNIHITDLWEMGIDTMAILIAVIVLSIIITGIYPVVAAMSKQPRTLFRVDKMPGKWFGSSVLAVLQYTAAVIVILWAFVVYAQLDHILNANLGLDRDNVVVIEAPVTKDVDFTLRFDNLTHRLADAHRILQATNATYMPGDYIGAGKLTRRVGQRNLDVGFDYNNVDENFINFFGLKLLAGRNFEKDDRGNAVMISRIAAQRLGFKDPKSAVGANLELDEGFRQTGWLPVEIIGVFEDFRTTSLFEKKGIRKDFDNQLQSRGILFTYKNRTFPTFTPERIALRILPKDFKEMLTYAEKEYKSVFLEDVFSWYFLNESINKVYQNEKIARNQILLFVVLAVMIACLGFLGIIMHAAISRTKEVGIRKILGAKLSHIGGLILRPSLHQFLIALVLAIPAALYLGELYLQKFSERAGLQWWHYALPVIIFIFFMLSSVVTVVWKAAKGNPVEALKYE